MAGSLAWALLILAGLLEVAFTTFLRLSDGFRNLWPTLGFFLAASGSFALLAQATRVIPLGIGYAVWVGVGAVGTILVGRLFFGEALSGAQLLLLALLIGSIAGLRLLS
jgi:quaternary ammonium compound-resistance protein SugE